MDGLHVVVLLLSCICCLSKCGAFYIPDHERHYHHSSKQNTHESHPSTARRSGDTAFSIFSNMRGHGAEHSDSVFAERLFHLFDLNGDEIIDLSEFKTTLEFLGVIQPDFDYIS
ncbi:uncharacterized protein LOC141912585 [Tubulanus polymorphus]|uniref:uncharacterized protein LOC141912585 n=1 Tax=Tubulanus polymorphus TaxID=672921 RepID=UPI003DA6A254